MVKKELARIMVQVRPGSSKNMVTSIADNLVYIKVSAPPTEGKANQALIEFLSDILKVPKSSITIEKGATSRRKIVAIDVLSRDTIMVRLKAASNSKNTY